MKKVIIFVLFTFPLKAFTQPYFHPAESRGEIENAEINEASGLAESITNPNMLWVHNDSGDKARIFLLDEYGHFKKEFILKGIKNRDWEDIATGPGPDPAKNYIYLAEIGDNKAVHDLKYIYRFEEPMLTSDQEIKDIEIITLEYPDGKRDAESLFVDPLTKDIYILSKREQNIGIYRAAFPQPTDKKLTLEKMGSIPYFNTVAADISPNGKEIITKTYSQILYWQVEEGSTIIETLLTKRPSKVPYLIEPQGESIAWKKDGSGFFTLSEEPRDIEAILYFYRKK